MTAYICMLFAIMVSIVIALRRKLDSAAVKGVSRARTGGKRVAMELRNSLRLYW